MSADEMRDALVATLDSLLEIIEDEETPALQRIEAARVVHQIIQQSRGVLLEERKTRALETAGHLVG